MGEQKTALILLLILCFAVVSILEIGIVKAESVISIYIRADGSIEGTDKIQRDGNIYTLTDNISNSTIFVEKDNVMLDGAGYTIRGQPSGIRLNERDNVTIKNFVITIDDFAGWSIYLDLCSNCTIVNNTLTSFPESDPLSTGITVWGGASNVIVGNRVNDNVCGITLEGTSNNSVFGNNITGNSRSMRIYASQNNRVYQNNFINNDFEVFVGGSSVSNVFDNGDAMGSYWSNYDGTDSDGDGIGDTPYIIDENNQDNYPLVNPVDISVIPEFPSWIILPLSVVATLVGIFYRNRLRRKVS